MRLLTTSITAAALLMTQAAVAELRTPAFVGDHMVIQRDMEAPLWGWADPGDTVTVSLAWQTHRTTANDEGRWEIAFVPMPAGMGHSLSIAAGDESLTFDNVAVGEVWICSGQSNMEWPVERSRDPNIEIAAANYPDIRIFATQRAVADAPQTDVTGQWQTVTSESIPGFSAVAYFFGRELHKELGVPIGLLKTAWGGTPAEAWTSRPALEAQEDLEPLLARWDTLVENYPQARKEYEQALADWEEAVKTAEENGEEKPNKPRAPRGPGDSHRPANLYNAMIAPFVPIAFNGAIWYQGESNASRAYQYRTIFPAMINDWRDAWSRDFPFLFVQLANYRDRAEQPGESDWAELREAQTMALELPNTGMAVAIDIGEADDIHPKDKQHVGKRLAYPALALVYGKNMAYAGPMFEAMTVEAGKARLAFAHTDGGLVAPRGTVKGFAIAGEDKNFVWADAQIEGDAVVVSSPDVPNPVAVRYGWADNPGVNLYNRAGLPASPFRTDDWPGITVDNK